MSDHLIAEANRHAKALAVERNNLSVELNLLREWQREVIQNARAHHAEREDAIARAERAEAEVAELKESILVQRIFSDYRQRAESAEAELATERARLDDLVADLNDACITLASVKDDCDDYALLNTGFKLTAVRDVLIQYIPNTAMKEGSK